MDDQQQNPPPDLTQLQAKHEANTTETDPYDVALLFNQVGTALTNVDKASVSPSSKSAMQLTEHEVFKGLESHRPASPPPPPPPPVANKPIAAPPLQTVEPAPRRPVVNVDQNIEKRILEMEKSMKKMMSFSSAYQKAKKIKRGLKYSVSSNSMKGEIKDADVLLEYVLCEISKGVKTITIKICED